MSKITYDFIDIEIPDFDPEFFSLWLCKVVEINNSKIDSIGYVFCNDEFLRDINKKHLNQDYDTDIISFNYNDKFSLNGEIFISWERVKDNSGAYSDGNDWDELCRVMVHGILHFLGYDDKAEEEKRLMREMEDESLGLRNSFT